MAVGAGDAISAMAAYLSRHSEELLAGTRVLTLSTRELARVTARLQQLARLSELGGGPGGQTPNDWSRQLDHWHASDLEYLRRLEYVRALLEGLRTLRVDEHDLHAGDGNPPTPPVTTSRMTSHERRRQQLQAALAGLLAAGEHRMKISASLGNVWVGGGFFQQRFRKCSSYISRICARNF